MQWRGKGHLRWGLVMFSGGSKAPRAFFVALAVGLLCSEISLAQTVNDLVYATVMNDNGTSAQLRMDLWENTTGEGPAPLVIWIHGGAWLAGSYNDAPPPLQTQVS